MRFFLWLIAIVILFFIWIRYIERHNIYFPMREISITPDAVGLAYEEAHFKTQDNVRLNGWFIPAGTDTACTVLFCHGNGGNISHRLEKISIFHDFGFNVFIFDYRGYGKSQGSPSEQGLYKDADAACAYLIEKRRIPERDIILYGESLGGAVAIHLAVQKKVKALITEDTFTSMRDMAKEVYPFIPGFLIASNFDALSGIRNVECPKLIIHSIDDEIVPFYLGERLFDAAPKPKTFLKTRGSHNTAFFDSDEQFRNGIKSFIDSL